MADKFDDEERDSFSDGFLAGDMMDNDMDIDLDDRIIDEDDDEFQIPKGDDTNNDKDEEDDDPNDPGDDEDRDEEENEEGDEDEKEEGDEEPVGDDAADTNEYYLRAMFWQENGVLSPDLEIPKDLDPLALENLYLKQIHEDALKQVRTEVKDVIKANGLDPEVIFGTESPDLYYQKEYKRIGGITYDALVENNDDVTATLRLLGTEYWISKSDEKLDEEAVAILVDKDLDKLSEEELYERYRSYFEKESKRLETKIQTDTRAKSAAETAKNLANAEHVKKTLSSGEIGGRKYTDAEIVKIQDALFKKNQIYDNKKGDRRVVTLFEKKRLEAGDDLNAQLMMAVNMVLGESIETVKEKSARAANVDMLQKLARLTGGQIQPQGNSKKGNTKKTTNRIKQDEYESMLMPD